MLTKTINYLPRKHVKAYHARKERWAVIVAHRRFGKTVAAINDLIRDALTIQRENVRCAYIAPYYRQAKAIAWDYLKEYTKDIDGVEINIAELRIDFANGARVRLFGADNYDSMRGLYFDSVVLDEPADFPVSAWPTVIRPALADRKGRATFIGTPKGKNEFWDTYHYAKSHPDWYCDIFKSSETGILDKEELEEAKTAMGLDRFEQEFECSFEAAIQGSFYAQEMKTATSDSRIGNVPYDPGVGVTTAWDLGISDNMCIWLMQSHGKELRLIGYYENSGKGMEHYIQWLQQYAVKNTVTFGTHLAPHDIEVRELSTGRSRKDTAREMGIVFRTVQRPAKKAEAIQAVRRLFPRLWLDEDKAEHGLNCLGSYHREWDAKHNCFRDNPVHDWASHGADALQTLALGWTEQMSSGRRPQIHQAKVKVNVW